VVDATEDVVDATLTLARARAGARARVCVHVRVRVRVCVWVRVRVLKVLNPPVTFKSFKSKSFKSFFQQF